MSEYSPITQKGNCLFCSFVSGEMTTPGVMYDDGKYMAFLSIFPNMEGVTVVIPKDHHGSDVLAMEDEALAEFVLVAKKVSQALQRTFDDVGRVGLVMEGTGIDHAHIKLYPFHGTESLQEGWQQFPSGVDTYFETYPGYISSNDSKRVDDEEIKALAERIKEAF